MSVCKDIFLPTDIIFPTDIITLDSFAYRHYYTGRGFLVGSIWLGHDFIHSPNLFTGEPTYTSRNYRRVTTSSAFTVSSVSFRLVCLRVGILDVL